jgi:hypothetical protein
MKRMTVISRAILAMMAMMGLVLSAQAQGADDKDLNAEIKAKLPKPMFVGTPTKIDSPNLDKASIGKQRTSFFVPKSVALLSEKKEISASDKEPIIGELAMVTDGDKEGSDGSFVELGPGVQYVQIDLGAAKELFAALVWHYHAQARVYHDIIVQVADDADFVTNVKTVFNNDHDNSAGKGIGKDKEYIETNEGKLVNFMDASGKPVKARYVRFYSNGNTANEMNHYIEAEIYGR